MAKKLDRLFDPDIIPENRAGTMKVAMKAKETVLRLFDQYDNMRAYIRGGFQINITEEWDELYRIYKATYCQNDHNYDGKAKLFMPEGRRAVNIVEAESSNAFFSREDYFSVDAKGSESDNQDMARKAFATIKYFSDKEDFVSEYDIANKQALIYNCTCVENVVFKERIEGLFRKLDVVPILDEESGEPLISPEGQVETRKEFNIYSIDEDVQSIRVEARDIYRMYINHLSNDPEKEDLIYRDSMSKQQLLEMAERGVYNENAVRTLIKRVPSFNNFSGTKSTHEAGDGKPTEGSIFQKDETDNIDKYEVLRFQGLFTTQDEKTGEKLHQQYWIDIGERNEVLRVIKNPLLGGYKTFSLVNYDTMLNEFYSDGVISPIKSLQYEINDKENQSVDGLTFDLNAPFEVLKGSGIKASDIMQIRKVANKAIFVKEMNSIRKVSAPVPLAHLNNELMRLGATIDKVTGATSLAGGSPTGTQADRSGKSLSILQNQTRSQFSKYVRKFEKKLLERSMQKCWDMVVQFFDDTIEIEIMGEDNKPTAHKQRISEIVGRFNIRVTSGSQFLKERQIRDSILEFLSILGINDLFMQMVDAPKMLVDIAKSMPNNMEKYIDSENLVNKLMQQIQQLQSTVELAGENNKNLVSDNVRLKGELQQTDRAAAANQPVSETEDLTPQ